MSSQRGAGRSTPQTVLAVDNPADVRGLIGLLLTRRGYRVAEAAGGERASDYLIKPFEAGELEGVLERLLPGKNSAPH